MLGVMLSSTQEHSNGLPAASAASGSPSAIRIARTRWTDVRFWAGVLLVVTSVLVGARVLSAADRTVEVWQANADLPSGSTLERDDVSIVRVHFDDGAAEARYLAADAPFPDSAVLTRDVAPDEMIPADAVATSTTRVLEYPLVVPASGFPSNLEPGDRVEVWAGAPEREQAGASMVLDEARVVTVSTADFATATSDRSVVVALPSGAGPRQVMESLAGRSVVLVRIGH